MLGIRLICVGKLKESFWKEAVKEYEKRLSKYCRLEILELKEEKLSENPSDKEIQQALSHEAAAIREKIPAGAAVIPMCIEGKTLSSEELAQEMNDLTVGGASKLCVIIGGSVGLSPEIKKLGQLKLSMSRMTFPHHLARVMVLEQLYRGFQIQTGGKYHK